MKQKGPIIYLNGVTSSGKTSIVNALRATGASFYSLSDDLFEDSIADIGAEYGSAEYWNTLAEAVFLMHRTACLFSDWGKTVVIDSMLLETEGFIPHYSQVQKIYAGYPLKMVEVFCPLEVCRQRNLLRGDRYEHQSRDQAAIMAQNIQYDLHLDTSLLTPSQCATKLLAFFRNTDYDRRHP